MKKDTDNGTVSLGSIAWRRFRKNKLAMFGVVVIALLILMSVCAPVLTTYGRDDIDLYNIEAALIPTIFWEQMNWGEMCSQGFSMAVEFHLRWGCLQAYLRLSLA